MKSVLLFGFCALLLVACGAEPEVLRTLPPPPTPIPAELASLSSRPVAAVGAVLFSENCAACHGEQGAGNGPLALSRQVPPPGNFRLGGQSRQSPQEWFDTITNGRLDRLMPPWSSLNAADRWELAWYSYTLAYSNVDLEEGASLWAVNCAACHGATGEGESPGSAAMSRPLPDFRDLDRLSQFSDEQLTGAIRAAHDELLVTVALDDEDLRALTRFVRSLSLGGVEYWAEVEPLPPLELPRTNVTLSLPAEWGEADTDVWLSASANGRTHERWPAELQSGIHAQVADVPLITDWLYQAHAVAGVEVYRSLYYRVEELTAIRSLPLYALTDGAEVLRQASLALQFQPANTQEMGDFVVVTQAFRLTNPSAQLYAEMETQAWQLPLPAGANLPEIAAPERQGYDRAENTIFGWQPILPGAGELVGLQYLLPRSALAVYEYRLPYGLDGALRILLPVEKWTLLGADLPALGGETLNGRSYLSYGADVSLPPGSVLRFGLGPASVVAPDTFLDTRTVFALMAVALFIMLRLVGWQRRR